MASTPSGPQLPLPRCFQAKTLSTKKARKATPFNLKKVRPPAIKSATRSESRLFARKYTQKVFDGDSYFNQCFENYGRLGEGSFGEVFKVKSRKDGKFYAVKKTKECYKYGFNRRSIKEVAQFKKVPKHSKCIEFYKSWQSNEHLYIQMELCENTLSYYCDENHEIHETLVWNYLVDLLLAVKHLHDHDLIHLDIKPANIFISKLNICKLGDFGLLFDLKSDKLADVVEGDSKYAAGEVIRGTFGKAADIFSLGITLLELACDLDLPSDGPHWQELRDGKLPYDLLKNKSLELRTIIDLMMSPNPEHRPTADQLLALPSVNKVWQKRKNVYFIAEMLSLVLDTFYSLIFHFGSFVNLFWTPLKQFFVLKQQFSTPKQSPEAFSRVNYNYSDADDIFDDSYSRTPKKNGFDHLISNSRRKNSSYSYCDTSPPLSGDRFNPIQIQPKKLVFELNNFDDDIY